MFKKIDEDKLLYDLSKNFNEIGKTLYLVGGSVRDSILNRTSFNADYDICGDASLDEVSCILNKFDGITYKIKNKKLQTLSISCAGKEYEYARLRKEIYDSKTTHSPYVVSFISQIEEDAKRRDFTVNSIYYDRYNSKLIDPLNGNQDLNKKIIKTTLSPEETLSVDPARILRLVELASRLNFKIDKETLKVAKKYAENVAMLPKQRLSVELQRIKCNYNKNEDKEGYIKRINKILKKLGLLNFVGKIV